MRKDVRFGLTIGAILLAVIVVYILVVPSDRPKGVTLETLNPDGSVAASVDAPGDADAASSTSQTPAPGPIADQTAQPAQQADQTTSPQLTRTPQAEASSDVDWASLLYRNQAAAVETRKADNNAAAPTPAQTPVVEQNNFPLANQPAVDNAPVLPAAPVNQPVAAPNQTYTVQSGDSLWTIAQKTYGDGSYHASIAAANPGVDSNHLKIGQVLQLPAQTTLSNKPLATREAATPATIDASRQYRVQSGDSLYRIAQKLYGNGQMADELYQVNRQTIGADPAKLKVGMVLQLPKAPTAAN